MEINNVFEYNQHFVAMMNVINNAKLNPPTKGHKHHIIPKCWYKMNGLEIDNSEENLVLLSYEDHILVHKLAILCAATPEMKSKMGFAVHRLLKGHFSGLHHTEETKKKLSKCRKGKPSATGWKHTDEAKKKMSEKNKGRQGFWNGKKMSEEHRTKLSESHKGIIRSEETKKKMSISHKGKHSTAKGKSWKIVNGKRVWFSKEDKHGGE